MREIKFRVWEKKLGKFRTIPKEFIGKRCSHLCMSTEQIDFCSFILSSTENFIYQQFTGLKDKNGKEIYEGDLINFTIGGKTHGPESEEIKGVEVFYSEEDAMFLFDRKECYSMIDFIRRDTLEVVGNIFKK